jgi:hypothetical protein
MRGDPEGPVVIEAERGDRVAEMLEQIRAVDRAPQTVTCD